MTAAADRPPGYAPDLALPDTHGTPVDLVSLRGGPCLVVFVPFAFSGTCTAELDALEADLPDLDEAGVRVLGISCDPVFALRAWREQRGYTFDLLSDFWPHGAAARAFGVLDERTGAARRGSFLLDADGLVVWSVVNPVGVARDPGAHRAALSVLGPSGSGSAHR
ncbi:redoxin domain-containing protein [Actinotalea sp. AC32]|nr:redoxin domain-containing protein [Actinotalea sp. AC32]